MTIHPGRAAVLAAGVACSLLLSACGSDEAEAERDPVHIGWEVPLSGPMQSIGEQMRDGFALYLELHDGKLGGRELKLHIGDEGADADSAEETAEKLLEEDVIALAGLASAEAFEAVRPLAAERGVPILGTGERPDVGPKEPQGLWQVSWTANEPAAVMGPYLYDNVDGPVYALGSESLGSKHQLESFAESFDDAGGTLANTSGEPARISSAWFADELNRVAQSGARAIYAAFSGQDAIDFVDAYSSSPASDIPLYGAFLTEEPLLSEQGERAEDVYSVANYYATVDNAANREFISAWAQEYDGQPSTYAMVGWDAALVLDRAIESITTKTITPNALDNAIKNSGEIDSPRGPWRFNENSHTPVQRWYLREVVEDGPLLVNTVIEDLATVSGT